MLISLLICSTPIYLIVTILSQPKYVKKLVAMQVQLPKFRLQPRKVYDPQSGSFVPEINIATKIVMLVIHITFKNYIYTL